MAKREFKDFAQLGLTGKLQVRDLWRQQDLPALDAAKDALPLAIPGHGVVLYKLIKVE